MEDHFCVTVRSEAMAFAFKHRPKLAVVVDLAVEGDPARLVFVGHRLMAAGAIDDGETAMPECADFEIDETIAIGTAMRDGVVHRPHRGALMLVKWSVHCERAGDAAHVRWLGAGPAARQMSLTPRDRPQRIVESSGQ